MGIGMGMKIQNVCIVCACVYGKKMCINCENATEIFKTMPCITSFLRFTQKMTINLAKTNNNNNENEQGPMKQ